MKNSTEIMKRIKEVRDKIAHLTAERDETSNRIHETLMNIKERDKRFEYLKSEECDTLSRKEHELQIAIDKYTSELRYKENNLKIAVFNEVVPIFLETLEKYKGKRYGEKTQQKISSEIKGKTGCAVYIFNERYSERVVIYDHENGYPFNRIEFSGKYNLDNGKRQTFLDGENKITPLPFEEISLDYINRTYYEDIGTLVIEQAKRKEKIKAMHEQMKVLIDEYNSNVVDGISEIRIDNYGVR